MKRTVILDPTHPDWAGPQTDPVLCRRLTGHLAARLREYTEEGIAPVDILRDGLVSAQIAGVDPHQAVSALARQRVFCQSREGALLFSIGADTSFEDLDYVQAVAAQLLK
ncbi:MAG TPA: hypothetical protein IAC25_06235 [Candidatus Enterenecus stercoripullorum]|nr:hypothetical protein [Candidatus Enterenecus stercoripullorum]